MAIELEPASQIQISESTDSQKVMRFYAKPLAAKWLKTFKTPRLLLVGNLPWDIDQWKATFKASEVSVLPFTNLLSEADLVCECELAIIYDLEASPALIERISEFVIKGGMLIWVTRNISSEWKAREKALKDLQWTLLYPVGFHPQGAVAFWPETVQPLTLLGKAMDTLMMFLPGRYESGLKWGRRWIVKAVKRDDFTKLH